MRLHRRKKIAVVPGAAPGTLVADPNALPSTIRTIAYGEGEILDKVIEDPAEIPALLEAHAVVWIDVVGLADIETIRRVGEVFNLHQLALEDVLHTHQRTKTEQYDELIYIVLWLMALEERLRYEQVSVFFAPGFVLSFQEKAGDCFDPVRNRLRQASGRIRRRGADYLAYALMDAVTDSYFLLLDVYGERLEELEDEILENPTPEISSRLLAIKRELQALRRATWPLREAFGSLSRDDHPAIQESTRPYLRDCYDHAIQVLEMVETCRERCSDLVNLYQSSIGNQMNAVMKVLTIIATIFIPLTFVAGIYGMNFDAESSPFNMPELGWYFGYPFAIALMLGLGILMALFFRRKGWL